MVPAPSWWESPPVFLEAGLLAIAAVVPLVFFRGVADTFELPKQIALRTLLTATLLSAVAAAALRLTHLTSRGGDLDWPRFRPALLRAARWPPLLATLLVAAVWLAATLASISTTISLWGVPSRWGGLRIQLSYLALFVIAAGVIRRRRHLLRLAAVTAASAGITSLYALIQRAGLDPYEWSTTVVEAQRVVLQGDIAAARPASTFGNPNFLGGYLVVAIFITAGGLLAARRPLSALIWSSGIVLQLLAMIFTLSRGAWIATAVGAGLLTLWAAAALGWPWRRIALGLAAVAVAAAAALWVTAPYLPSTGILGRLASIRRPTEETGGIRLVLWRMTIQTWLDRPALGFGPDTFAAVYERHYDLDLQRREGAYTDHNRAENALLDTLIAAGAVGALALAVLGGMVAWSAWRLLRQSRSLDDADVGNRPVLFLRGVPAAQPLALGFIIAVVAHLVAEQTNPEVVGSSFLAWIAAGAICGAATLATSTTESSGTNDGRVTPPLRASRRTRGIEPLPRGRIVAAVVATLVVVAGSVFLFTQEVRALRARQSFDLALALARQDQPQAYADAMEQTVTVWPYDPRYWAELAYARLALAEARPAASRQPFYTRALDAAEHALRTHPQHPFFWSYYAEVASRVASTTNDATLKARAHDANQRSVELAPRSWEMWQRYGLTEFRLGSYQAAADAYQRSLGIFDKYWVVWTNYGDAAARLGDRVTARRAWTQALDLCRYPGTPKPCASAEEEAIRRALASLGPA